MTTHRTTRINEFYEYIPKLEDIYINFIGQKNYYRIDSNLEKDIISLVNELELKKKIKLGKSKGYPSFNKILDEIEMLDFTIEEKEIIEKIKKCRIRLGSIVNENELILLIDDFSKGLDELVNEF